MLSKPSVAEVTGAQTSRGPDSGQAATYQGFPRNCSYIPVPTPFFSEVLGETEDVRELKATLAFFWLLQRKRAQPRFVLRSELLAKASLLFGPPQAGDREKAQEMLAEGLRAARTRGILLGLVVKRAAGRDVCYFSNTEANRRLVQRLEAGEAVLPASYPEPAPAEGPKPTRPDIFRLYEQNIGLLTPLIADQLQEAANSYPAEWLEDAFREAVSYNRRNWRYVLRILERWSSQGRGDIGTDRRISQAPGDTGAYIRGRYGHLIGR